MFIVFDGLDGAGKSTHLKLIKNWLEEINYKYVFKREPGGSELAENIRKIFLKQKYDSLTQLMLISLARLDNTNSLVNHNGLILFDRYIDSTYAYQREVENSIIDYFVNLTAKIKPDFTFLFLNQYRTSNKNYLDEYSNNYQEELKKIYIKRSENSNKYMIIPKETKEKQHEIIKNKIKELIFNK